MIDISKELGIKAPNSVGQALQRFNIPIRSISDGLSASRSNDLGIEFNRPWKFNKSVLDGCLLGDGYLSIYNSESPHSYPKFCKKNKYASHILYTVSTLIEDCSMVTISPEYKKWVDGRNLKYYGVYTDIKKELKPIYDDWYPSTNSRQKIIPRNINIDSTVLLHWFMDDGYSCRRIRDGHATNQIILGFCSESFSKEDQEWICNQFNSKYDIGMYVKKTSEGSKGRGTGYRIRVLQSKVKDFYNVIGVCPVVDFEYKWKHDIPQPPRKKRCSKSKTTS
jgi:hypothetical protein